MENKALSVDMDLCTGCKSCMIACSFRNEKVFSLRRSRIWIPKNESECLSVPTICEQCDPAPCMLVCPTKAITRDPKSNATMVNKDKCINCKECLWACPFGAINMQDGMAKKCELCQGTPACVEVCPHGALVFVDIDHLAYAKKRRFLERRESALSASPKA